MSGLTERDRIVLDTLLPADADPRLPQGVLDVDLDAVHREFEREAPSFIRTAFGLALFAATWLAPLLVARRPPLGRLGRDDRERALVAMADSRIAVLRQLLVLLKLIVGLAYGADPAVRDAIGYSRRAM